MTTSEQSPLSETKTMSLDELFSSKPPFSAADKHAMIAEFRAKRVKWQLEEREGKAKKATKARSSGSGGTQSGGSVGDLFGE